jgi:hypothetical protein
MKYFGLIQITTTFISRAIAVKAERQGTKRTEKIGAPCEKKMARTSLTPNMV